VLDVADNSGARKLQLISVKGYKGVKSRLAKAGVGDVISASVVDGVPDLKHKVVPAVIIRQKMPYRRPSGERVSFFDNAAILLKDVKDFEPKGTTIKGPIAREVLARFPHIGRIAKTVV
jgi:large subunit ribosomal protein L14